MIALDANILARYLAQDDDAQFQAVLRLLSRKSAVFFVSDLVLMELDWVMRSLYEWTNEEMADAFARLMTVHNLAFEDESRLRSALRGLREGADLADELIVRHARARGCSRFATFDKAIIRRHKPFAVSL